MVVFLQLWTALTLPTLPKWMISTVYSFISFKHIYTFRSAIGLFARVLDRESDRFNKDSFCISTEDYEEKIFIRLQSKKSQVAGEIKKKWPYVLPSDSSVSSNLNWRRLKAERKVSQGARHSHYIGCIFILFIYM